MAADACLAYDQAMRLALGTTALATAIAASLAAGGPAGAIVRGAGGVNGGAQAAAAATDPADRFKGLLHRLVLLDRRANRGAPGDAGGSSSSGRTLACCRPRLREARRRRTAAGAAIARHERSPRPLRARPLAAGADGLCSRSVLPPGAEPLRRQGRYCPHGNRRGRPAGTATGCHCSAAGVAQMRFGGRSLLSRAADSPFPRR